MNTRSLALYLHIPFCAAKCAYCDFVSYPNREDVWEVYLDVLLKELESWRPLLNVCEVRTVFLGGGTPSLLPAQMLERLLEGVFRQARVAADAEITMEANPGTLTRDKLRRCRAAGVNRLSVGAQSMDDRLLRALGRIHCAEDVREAVRMARDAGFENLNLDLMYALPGQSLDDWQRTLDETAEMQPEHISAYSLIVEEGTPLAECVDCGTIAVPDDEAAVEMQRLAVDCLAEHGWSRYEISNYSRPGFECRHNIVYWQRGEYLGLGCAAHSLVGETRFENPRTLEAYLSGARRLNAVQLTREDAMEETLMLSTRMARGLDLAAWRAKFGADFEQTHARTLEKLTRLNLVELRDGFLRLTGRGMELQNAVVVELMDA